MEKEIKRLIRTYGTNDPFRIAEALNIHIRFEDLGEHTKGMYCRLLRRRFIAIHKDLSEEWSRFICAHELAHDRLHVGVNRFFVDESSFFVPGKYERQANNFALKLLTANDPPEPGTPAEVFLKRNGIPAEMFKYFLIP